MKTVYLYSTPGCHLCEIAWDLLVPLIVNLPLRLEEVDIAESDALIDCYGVKIPVLKFADSDEELGWPFNTEQLSEFIKNQL